MSTPFFTNLQCETALPWKELTDKLEGGFKSFANGEIEQPVREMLPIKQHSGFLGLMPCYSKADNVSSVKLVSVYPQNTKLGISSHIVYVLVFNSTTGELQAIMEGDSITKRRTAAASALSAKWLASPNPVTLSILGAGHQALAHMQVLLDQYDSISKIRLWNHRKSSALKLAEEVCGWLKAHQEIEIFDSADECAKNADLIVTATFTSRPILHDGVKPKNCHMMAVGAPRPDWAEIDPKIWINSRVFVDSFAGAKAESGDLLDSQCEIEDELGNFILKNQKNAMPKRTIFKSLGLAMEDLVAANMVTQKVKKSSPWPIPFYQGDQIKTTKENVQEPIEKVANQVTNLKCEAFLLTEDCLVTELETSSTRLGLVYAAKTGTLKSIIDMKNVEDFKKRKLIYLNTE